MKPTAHIEEISNGYIVCWGVDDKYFVKTLDEAIAILKTHFAPNP